MEASHSKSSAYTRSEDRTTEEPLVLMNSDNTTATRRRRARKAKASSGTREVATISSDDNAEVASKSHPDRNLQHQLGEVENVYSAFDNKEEVDGKLKAPVTPVAISSQQRSKKKNRNKRKNKSHADRIYSWRKHIPKDAVDPITLEPIDALTYPPFVLVASEPYDPIFEWPVPLKNETVSSELHPVSETEVERQRRVLQEQWGDKMVASETTSEMADSVPKAGALSSKRHFHFYDGFALAYYCVSQLQFIDPLNRRDLNRDELVNLDRYLRRHGVTDLNVTEAYDVKGVSISTAGAVGSTATGRAVILQQEARVLLNALFHRNSVASVRSENAVSVPTSNLSASQHSTLRSLYQAHEESQYHPSQSHRLQQLQEQSEPPTNDSNQDTGIYFNGDGYVIIDDDLNPRLRGNAPEFVPQMFHGHIFQHNLSRDAHVQVANFPCLSETSGAMTEFNSASQPSASTLPKPQLSASLSRIASCIQKTDPMQQRRQWLAREEARRKAMLSQLSFGNNAAPWDKREATQAEVPTSIDVTIQSFKPVSESLLLRNQAVASALGVAPSTTRSQSNSHTKGWARSVVLQTELDEFGKELQTVYPGDLILKAKAKMSFLVKVEKKLLKFLTDDSAPSHSFNPMDRSSRAFLYEYMEYWKLEGQSYDCEPNRYIHCTKKVNTCSPSPLLSEAIHNGKRTSTLLKAPDFQHDLQPLISISAGRTINAERAGVLTSDSRIMSRNSESVRPKLQLSQRTVPLELPLYMNPPAPVDVSVKLQRRLTRSEVKATKPQDRSQSERAAMEAAFASDDDDSDSDWEEKQEQYHSSDDDKV